MLPLAPRRQEATDPVAALTARTADGPDPERQIYGLSRAAVVTLTEADAREFELPVQHVEIRRDALVSRRRWQFGLREDAILTASS